MEQNRYLIYDLLRQSIEIQKPDGKRVNGVVSRVYRDVLTNKIELTVGKHLVEFVEPAGVFRKSDTVLFVYGDLGAFIDDDETLFTAIRDSVYSGESADDVLKRTAPDYRKEIRFIIQPKEKGRKRQAA